MWSDGKCYKYQEQELQYCDGPLLSNSTHITCREGSGELVLLSTFENCPTNECTEIVVRPQVKVQKETICKILNICDTIWFIIIICVFNVKFFEIDLTEYWLDLAVDCGVEL